MCTKRFVMTLLMVCACFSIQAEEEINTQWDELSADEQKQLMPYKPYWHAMDKQRKEHFIRIVREQKKINERAARLMREAQEKAPELSEKEKADIAGAFPISYSEKANTQREQIINDTAEKLNSLPDRDRKQIMQGVNSMDEKGRDAFYKQIAEKSKTERKQREIPPRSTGSPKNETNQGERKSFFFDY